MPKAKPDQKMKIAEAALRLAAQGWSRATLDAVAKQTKIPLAQVKKLFAHADDILPSIVAYVDAQTAKSVGKIDRRIPTHDRLFEILMARFDILQKHRTAILSMMKAVQRDPSLIRKLLPVEAKAMEKALRLAGLDENGLMQPLAIAGLLGVYGITLYCWRNDDNPDMAKTMAALDRNLKRATKAAEIIFRAA